MPSKVLPIPLIVQASWLLSVLRPPSYFAQRRFVDGIEWVPVPKKSAPPKPPVAFIQTMDCLPVSELPEGEDWTYELKLDGYRLEVVRSSGKTTLYSRRQNILNKKFDYIAESIDGLPEYQSSTANWLRSARTASPTSTCCRISDLHARG